MAAGAGRLVSVRAREIAKRGERALLALPAPDRLAGAPDANRRKLVEDLRLELYAVSGVVAGATLERALREREAFPPYGLARSLHSQLRLVVASPRPYEAGSVASFYDLGRAYLDTLVFHLDAELRELRGSERAWLVRRIDAVLALLREGADERWRARMRDAFSFLYGGLHFGTSVCVQMVEAMTRLLASHGVPSVERAAVLARSSRPALELAAVNVDHVVPAYQRLLEGGEEAGRTAWMDPRRFALHRPADGVPRIELQDEGLLAEAGHAIALRYATRGCPARVSTGASRSAISLMWTWCVELAEQTGLLGETVPASTDADGT